MPRVCNREGCGARIVGKDGSPDYRKHFCGPACLRADKRERLLAKRQRLKTRRCPQCGHGPGSESPSNGRVKLQHGSSNAATAQIGAKVERAELRGKMAVSDRKVGLQRFTEGSRNETEI